MKKLTAIVTGASSGIGKEVARLLLEQGATVIGAGRRNDFGTLSIHGAAFIPVHADFSENGGAERFAAQVRSICKERSLGDINVLVNCAGCAFYGLHETLTSDKIHEMVAVNVEAPMVLTSQFLRELRENKGVIVNVSSVTAKSLSNTHGCAYGATKAALTSFGASLFEEVRKHGVKVCTVHPDLTDTELYRNADFTVSGEEISCISATEVAQAVLCCINARDGLVVTDVTVRPSINKIIKKTH